MPKFLCLQRSLQSSTPEDERPSPAEMQAMFAKFGEWQEQFKDQVPDMGGRLGSGTVVTHGDVDGPYVEVKELVDAVRGGAMQRLCLRGAGTLRNQSIDVRQHCR